jgi:alpha-1,6-mannosyl-glycoprotein beta-1,2-N-acetylglucosaminyltransferase
MTQWNLNKNLQFMDLKNDSKSIQRFIERINDEQAILNDDRFGQLQNDSIIIVIQVHKRAAYLRHLIDSLGRAKHISKTLLIFSHDFYDEEINELVQSIDFCRVMQIFYPFSIQTHPNEFPGTSAFDCRRDMKKEDAIRLKCNNAFFPDGFGHYREAKYTQMKHHYWWKLNRIFDELNVTRNMLEMLLLLLEEDYMVAPDFLLVLNQLRSLSILKCGYCNILSLGTYDESINSENYYKVDVNCHANLLRTHSHSLIPK